MSQELHILAGILKQHLGLDMQTVGQATIEKIFNQRMRRCNIKSRSVYLQHLEQTPGELKELLETAVIPETWFFRDTRPFPVLLQHLKQQQKEKPGETFRIFCVPSSTGEEPYSIAMYFSAHHVHAGDYEIMAADISRRAIDIAQQGVYNEHSFRGTEVEDYRASYFTETDGGWALDASILQQVSFTNLNILGKDVLPYNNYFDCILCRNLLIYFDQSGRYQALSNLHRVLKDDGLLFLGYSEFGILPQDLFQTTAADNAYALIKASQQKPAPKHQTRSAHNTRPRTTSGPVKKPDFKTIIDDSLQQQKKIETGQASTTDNERLASAKALSDAGNYQEAETLCLESLKVDGPSDTAYYLLGLIHQSAQHTQLAEEFYRKVLFLNPEHYETLIQLAWLRDNAGDQKAAQLLRNRASRIEGKQAL